MGGFTFYSGSGPRRRGAAPVVYRAFLLALAALPLHVGGHDELLRQDLNRVERHLFSRYEHLVMRAIEFLSSNRYLHGNRATKRLVDMLGGYVMDTTNGEVLTLEEAREVVGSIAEAGYTVAVGTCPCRRARNLLSDDVPNNTDMVFGPWADEYLAIYPGLYRALDLPEALDLLDDFDRHGFIHQVYGFKSRVGAVTVLCNCAPDVCVPLHAQKLHGYQAFRKGRARARVDGSACLGVEECGACIGRCPFDARVAVEGRGTVLEEMCFGCGLCVSTCRGGATRLERVPGAELVYARDMVKS